MEDNTFQRLNEMTSVELADRISKLVSARQTDSQEYKMISAIVAYREQTQRPVKSSAEVVVGERLVPSRAAGMFWAKYSFMTIAETNMLMRYDDDSGRWKDDGEELVKSTLQHIYSAYLSRTSVNEVIEHLKRERYVDGNYLNSLKGFVNLQNGVYDTEQRKLLPHDPNYSFTYTLPFKYDAKAECPEFLKFLSEITQGDAKLMVSIMEGFAYSFVPGYPIQKANMLVGSGANGKSVLLAVLRALLGKENCSALTLQEMEENKFAMAWLNGKLANISPDLPSRGLYNTGVFKALTGGDLIYAEMKYAIKPIGFENGAKQWFSANVIPQVEDDTDGFFRRWNIWEFKAKFPEGVDIVPKLTTDAELAGIFNLIVEIFLPVVQKQLRYTFSLNPEQSRSLYLKNSDTAKAFVEDCMSYDPQASALKSDVWEAYVEYCKALKLIQLPDRAFWRRLKQIVVYTERQIERGGPRAIYGQAVSKIVLEQPASTASISSSIPLFYTRFLNVYYNREIIDESDVIVGSDATSNPNSNNLLENPLSEGAKPQVLPIFQENGTERSPNIPKAAPSQLRSCIFARFAANPSGIIMGHEFELVGDMLTRRILSELARAGDIFEPRPGEWKLTQGRGDAP